MSTSSLMFIRMFMFVLSVLLYCYSGYMKQLTFPWFVGDAFCELESDMDLYDGSEMLVSLCWLVFFVGISYFIYLDTQRLSYPILYFVAFYQYIVVVSMDEYYQNTDYLFIHYLSGLMVFACNGFILAKTKYLFPYRGTCFNVFIVHLCIILYLALFLYESIFGSLYRLKFASKMLEVTLFYGSILFIIKYKPSTVEETTMEAMQLMEASLEMAKLDEILYNMRIEIRNAAMIQDTSDETDSESSVMEVAFIL
eukprot:22173_1